jgi:hypothetical protein
MTHIERPEDDTLPYIRKELKNELSIWAETVMVPMTKGIVGKLARFLK